MAYLYLGAAVLAGAFWLIGYIIHLRFGRFVLRETKDPASLKHAAEFARGYRSANFKSISDAIAKLGRKGRTPTELYQAVEHHGSPFGATPRPGTRLTLSTDGRVPADRRPHGH